MSKKNNNNIVWFDLELTGLNVHTDVILEVACVVSDPHLEIFDDGLDLVIHQPDSILQNMSPWCMKQHEESALIQASKESKITIQEADIVLTDYVKKYLEPGEGLLAGNSVYMDRWFMEKHLPNLHKYLHYRMIDVSSIKELCKRWNYKKYSMCPEKKLAHRALDDIKESIHELRFYRNNFFNLSD